MKTLWTIFVLLSVLVASADESWRFLTLADWHQAEKYTQTEKRPDWLADAIAEDIATVKMLKRQFGGELIMLPGDSQGGHWDTPAFIRRFRKGSTPEQTILEAGRLCYSGMIESFRKGGYSKLLMAVGDHEMGDNPWPAGSAVARCQPQFREAFAREFNMAPDGKGFIYSKPVGKAHSRPLNTPYENTSFAYRHRNVLFVTVDAFHQESPDKVIGSQGSVTGTVTGKHLEWLEQVLAEARRDETIKHIFVQSHLPVLYPVRKVNSSGMMMDDNVDNPFWQLLRKYSTDIYFAGEVHANTVTKDPDSSLVQVVSRGNFFNNFLTVDVHSNRLEITLYNQTGENSWDGEYEIAGRLLIDKSGSSTNIRGDGELALLRPREKLFHFSFENSLPLAENRIVGLAKRKGKTSRTQILGTKCTRIFPNTGEFGRHYSALCANIDMVEGPRGRAGRFTEDSRMGIFGMGPLQEGHAVSYALWIRTAASGNRLLINTGSIWGNASKGFFNLNLNNGVPEIMTSRTQSIAAKNIKLNDGTWHHIAASMPKDNCKLSHVRIFVDGIPAKTTLKGPDCKLNFNQAVRMGIGGKAYSNKSFNAVPVEPFVGELDELMVWTRPLQTEEVKALSKSKQ